jgi:hypothetical protein
LNANGPALIHWTLLADSASKLEVDIFSDRLYLKFIDLLLAEHWFSAISTAPNEFLFQNNRYHIRRALLCGPLILL